MTDADAYVELHAASAFSFLDGASLPEDIAARAAELGQTALALVDRNGFYGAPRFFKAAKEFGLKPLVGAEVVLDEPGRPRLTLLAETRQGYRNLSRLLTRAAQGRPKGEARAGWDGVAEHAAGLHALTGGGEGLIARHLDARDEASARGALRRLTDIFPGRLHVEVQRHFLREQERRNAALMSLAREHGLPLLASNAPLYARPSDKDMHDVLACIREHTNVDAAVGRLALNRERYLKSAREMEALFSDVPHAVRHARNLSDRLGFTLDDLGYRFPDYPLPAGETPGSLLRRLTEEGASARFRPYADQEKRQIQRELDLIGKLQLEGYFLIVWDIVRFCREKGIMAQGRGSAANSAVCYALGITAVDPIRMELLFERFLSENRGEWPDIDLDLPSGARRESVIQYVYQRYGPFGAAMTANVITYRGRSAARDVGKALGLDAEIVDKLSRRLGRLGHHGRPDPKEVLIEVASCGLDLSDVRTKKFITLWGNIQSLPRHLGQHSGGIVIAAGRLDDVVPLEPAAMPGRVVIQWDKDDCADLGLIKIDLLGLGMMAAMEEAIPMIERHENIKVDLAHLPKDDPAILDLLGRADTIGLFQLESRAQIASLPSHKPRCFYDIVVQVAIIRPGPIVGGMIKPFFNRHQKREPVTYPHPSLEPVLKRTLGVPLFQEQILRMAMVAGGFSGGEAEELRRAIGFKRSVERMRAIEARLRERMAARKIPVNAREQVIKMITSFALYGFPESHAASFALLAYASAYLKVYHPAAFYVSLLNAWPMGFYHPAVLIKDAQRRGVAVFPVDVNASGWACRWESNGIRLGMRFIRGLSSRAGRRIEAEREEGAFMRIGDLAQRADLRAHDLDLLAHAGALASLGLTRREALWQAARVPAGPLFKEESDDPSPLPEMTPLEETSADLASLELTAGPHVMAHLRDRLRSEGILSAADLNRSADRSRLRSAGCVIVRQRPGTAKGFVFLTLEDETGMFQAIIRPDDFKAWRDVLDSPALIVDGVLQKSEGQHSMRVSRVMPLNVSSAPSHDYH